MKVCKCGCGRTPAKGARYVNGHNGKLTIRPAGMTYERALEIAIESDRRRPTPIRVVSDRSGNSNGHRVSDEDRAWVVLMTGLGKSASEIAVVLGITRRTVERVRAERRAS